ncbi:mitotic spindle assembly checkpoint protein MAD1 isoform X2 [Chanos chanos]|uniref:Mitotic spindle assembly checkpoint protein MAD1 n=1 Tax=Chanos chanos TaxID=29144 RepID=A0A6J2VTH6_CHACN|nr:mitotic spindle assembly checkpoint protein MAD1 isoform X2 [Chanos chanos]
MDDLEDDTTVFSTLKSFKNFITRPDRSLSEAGPAYGRSDLQKLYTQRLEMEEAAERIHSHTNLLQLTQEKQQMELSHKRARIELEKAAHLSSRDLQREVDRNQDLLTRIRRLEDREADRQRLEEQNNILEMRLERHNLQGDYDPVKTKVIHFRLNPTSVAKQQRAEEVEQLREECQRLRDRLRTLQAEGTMATDDASFSIPPSQEVLDLRKQMESAELKNQRLKEVFQKKIQEFRTACYVLTGYQIDITMENQYRLTSVYAERMEDCLLFKANGPVGSGSMQLLETDFSRTLTEMVDLHLFHQKSIPAFLSAVTLDLFSRQTII